MRKTNKYAMTYKEFLSKTSHKEMQELVNASSSMTDLFRKASMCAYSTAFRAVEQYFDANDINYAHFTSCNPGHIERTFDNIFCKDSSACSKIVRDEYRKLCHDNECCDICGISQWNGQNITLQLDHINGINNDNRLENLRLICPNCHSQTQTFCRSNSFVASHHSCLICGISILHKNDICYNCFHDLQHIKSLVKNQTITPHHSIQEISDVASLSETQIEKIIEYDTRILKLNYPKNKKCHCSKRKKKTNTQAKRSARKSLLSNDQYEEIKNIFLQCFMYTDEMLNIANVNTKAALYNAIKRYEHAYEIEHNQTLSELYKQNQKSKCPESIDLEFVSQLLDSSFKAMGRKYGVSDNTIRKWLIRAGYSSDIDELFALYESAIGHQHPKQRKHSSKSAPYQQTYIIKIAQIDKNGNVLSIYKSAREADPDGHGTRIHECCRGKRHFANGYIWRYLGINNEPVDPSELDTYKFNTACSICGRDTGSHNRILCPDCVAHQKRISNLVPELSIASIDKLSTSQAQELLACLLDCLNAYSMASLSRLVGHDPQTIYKWFERLGMPRDEVRCLNAENNERRKKK